MAVGIEMWFKEDVRNILLSINVSSAGAARMSDRAETVAYRCGYQEALFSVALACGIRPAEIAVPSQAGRMHGHYELPGE
jgi:hypothetical protein